MPTLRLPRLRVIVGRLPELHSTGRPAPVVSAPRVEHGWPRTTSWLLRKIGEPPSRHPALDGKGLERARRNLQTDGDSFSTNAPTSKLPGHIWHCGIKLRREC